jgi:hypothetical protein
MYKIINKDGIIMIEYSMELKNNIEKIGAYYKKYDAFEFLQKIINNMFM